MPEGSKRIVNTKGKHPEVHVILREGLHPFGGFNISKIIVFTSLGGEGLQYNSSPKTQQTGLNIEQL